MAWFFGLGEGGSFSLNCRQHSTGIKNFVGNENLLGKRSVEFTFRGNNAQDQTAHAVSQSPSGSRWNHAAGQPKRQVTGYRYLAACPPREAMFLSPAGAPPSAPTQHTRSVAERPTGAMPFKNFGSHFLNFA
ncbi:MAG: hypothetical protein KatS3mg109_0280 [Pirellulaceae bacterium]|nr:MAG: hypothetical protein KatS3mg109_0280 [Pirellulaceae bacterium]